jgi:arylsulfatase A-like enzyme
MPTLSDLARRGVVFSNHHSVFPSVTRVNASSISTGTYPESHGLMGNTIFIPQVDPRRFLDTGRRNNLLDVQNVSGGVLLTAPTLGEMLQRAGHRMLVVSAGSTGSSFLLNHTVAGGAVLHAARSHAERRHQPAGGRRAAGDRPAPRHAGGHRAVAERSRYHGAHARVGRSGDGRGAEARRRRFAARPGSPTTSG